MLPSIKAKLTDEFVKERDKYLTKDTPRDAKGDELVQAAAATIGFFSEISHHRKDKQVKGKAFDCEIELTAAETPEPSRTQEEGVFETAPTPKGLAEAFLQRHPLPISTAAQPSRNLATPVVIPQRRPNSRARGFIPAYAPILDDFDIPQTAFLDFITTLNTSLEPSPYLNAINLASFAGEASPEPLVGFLIGEAVATVTDAIMEAQSRFNSSSFLDKANEGFFAPRGLYAFVGIWRPDEIDDGQATRLHASEDASVSQPRVDVADSYNVHTESETVAARGEWRKIQRAMLPAGGNFSTVDSAPLLWPSNRKIAAVISGNTTKKKGRIDRAGLWINEHVDQHSQAIWAQEHPCHPLASSIPKPGFRSRYADPSHTASSGDVVALLTGGQWHTKEDEKKKDKEAQKQLKKERKIEKKLRSKEEKARSKSEKLERETKATNDEISKTDIDGNDAGAEQSGHEAINDGKSPSKEGMTREKPRSSLSSLLEDVGCASGEKITASLIGSIEPLVLGHRATSFID